MPFFENPMHLMNRLKLTRVYVPLEGNACMGSKFVA